MQAVCTVKVEIKFDNKHQISCILLVSLSSPSSPISWLNNYRLPQDAWVCAAPTAGLVPRRYGVATTKVNPCVTHAVCTSNCTV